MYTHTPQQCADVIIHIMTDDPTKVIDCIEGAESMIRVGADMGTSRHLLMAEEAIHNMKVNSEHLPDFVDAITSQDDDVCAILAAHFERMGW